MRESDHYVPNAGQTHMPVTDNISIPFLPCDPPAKPDPPLPELVLTKEAKEKGYILASQKQHFLPGVTAEMLDWFWANMEKGYYLWAPGSHKRFSWVKAPCDFGIEDSVHMIAETTEPELPVFGGDGVMIHRLHLTEFYPCTDALAHVICEGVFNDAGELVDSTIHEWEDRDGGCVHITATVTNARASAPPAFIIDILKNDPEAVIVPNYATSHEDYEAGRWPVFLPGLYALWKDHPDPFQSVRCSLEVQRGADGRFTYRYENGPVKIPGKEQHAD